MDSTMKHAYLIMAHKNSCVLNTLLKMIDDISNDIFIHMDIKNNTYSEDSIKLLIKKSNVYFIERKNVTWGVTRRSMPKLIY